MKILLSVSSIRILFASQHNSVVYRVGLFKTGVIDFMGPWKSVGQVEWETLKWVNRYNTKRLHSKIGYITPQEAEQKHYQTWNAAEKAA